MGDTDPDTGDLVTWSDGDCDADDFSVGGTTAGTDHLISYSPAVDLAADGVHDDDVTIEMINTSSAQDDCKNVTVPLYLAAS